MDVRELFSGGKTVFWKTDQEWRTELDSLLSLAFLDAEAGENETERIIRIIFGFFYFCRIGISAIIGLWM